MYRPLFIECPAVEREAQGREGLLWLAAIGEAMQLRAWLAEWEQRERGLRESLRCMPSSFLAHFPEKIDALQYGAKLRDWVAAHDCHLMSAAIIDGMDLGPAGRVEHGLHGAIECGTGATTPPRPFIRPPAPPPPTSIPGPGVRRHG